MSIFIDIRVDRQTKQAALPAGLELAILDLQLEDHALGGLARLEPLNQLNLTAKEVTLARGIGITLFDNEEGIGPARVRGDGHGEAEAHAGISLFDRDRISGSKRCRDEDGRQKNCGEGRWLHGSQ